MSALDRLAAELVCAAAGHMGGHVTDDEYDERAALLRVLILAEAAR